jgi:hypothetical protein
MNKTLDKEEFKALLEAIKNSEFGVAKGFRQSKDYTTARQYKTKAYEIESIIMLLEDDKFYDSMKSLYLGE